MHSDNVDRVDGRGESLESTMSEFALLTFSGFTAPKNVGRSKCQRLNSYVSCFQASDIPCNLTIS